MRRKLTITLAATAALVASAVGLAAVFTATGISATTATLEAKAEKNVKTRSCTGADGKEFEIVSGHYRGTADFTNPASDLDGPLALHITTKVDTASQLGYVTGSFGIRDDDTRVAGRFVGTLKGTAFSGFLTGTARSNRAVVLGTLSGTFDPATGFSGTLGSGPVESAVVAGPVCAGKSRHGNERKPKSERKPRLTSVEGAVSAVTTDSITIASRKGLPTATCVRDEASPAIDPAQYGVGTRIQMKCEHKNDTWVLRVIAKHS